MQKSMHKTDIEWIAIRSFVDKFQANTFINDFNQFYNWDLFQWNSNETVVWQKSYLIIS